VKYLVLLIGDGEVKPWADHTPDEKAEVMGRFRAFDEACAARDGVELLAGEALAEPSDATTLRTRGGQLQLTEGPYAEVVEGMGGFYLIGAPHLDVLVDLLGVLPPYDMQISPVVDVSL
jgi:hypothetical protein